MREKKTPKKMYMYNKNHEKMKSPENSNMGLSIVTRLQQEYFFSNTRNLYTAKILANSILFYPITINKNKEREVTEKQLKALTGEKFTGVLSYKSQQKIIQTCQNWADTLEYLNQRNRKEKIKTRKEIVLLTLTLSDQQKNSDNWIKRNMLNRFLIKIVREKPDTKYLWKAEKQKNGNLHFHILIDNYFDKRDVQIWWNEIQRDNNYHRAMPLNRENLGSPSTRIESLKDKDNGIAYIAKYMQKNNDNIKVEGRIWGCSRQLRELKTITYNVKKEEIKELADSLINYVEDYFCNEYCLIIKRVRDIAEIKNHLYNLAPIAQYTFEHNVDKLNARALTAQMEIESSDWFLEIAKHTGEINTSYAFNNQLLFNF